MRKIRAKLLVLLLAAFILLPGCMPEEDLPEGYVAPSPTPSKPPEIVVPSGAAVSNIFGIAFTASGSLNPITGNSRLNMVFMPLIYEGLFSIGGTFEAQPVLCESFERSGNAYIFHLKRDAHFSDGSDLTAGDVKYSLELAKTGGTIYADRLKYVTAISAADDDTVRIELSRSVGRLEMLLDIPIIKKDTGNDTSPPGTGPYIYAEGEGESYLKAYSEWWQKKDKPTQRIELIDAPEADLLINYFETGAVSMASNDPTATDPVVFGGDYEEWSYPTSIMYYLGTNTASGPMTDSAVRRAIGIAVDRNLISDTEMLRYADPAVFPVSPSCPLYSKSMETGYSFSLNDFSEKLAAAGYNADKPLTISFIVNSENSFKSAVAGRIAEDLRAMGVIVDLRELKWDDYLKALTSGNFDLYLAEVKMSPDFDLTPLISRTGALNYGKYSSDETELLLDAFISADNNSIGSASKQLYLKVAEDAPIIPILFKRDLVMAKRGVITEIAPIQSNIFNSLKK